MSLSRHGRRWRGSSGGAEDERVKSLSGERPYYDPGARRPTVSESRTEDERELHRVRIAHGDLTEAVEFIDAAVALGDVDPKTNVTHRGLVCAAVIFYARPFLQNEHPNEKRRPPDAAASLVELTPEELADIIPDSERRALHDDLILMRKKVVAHAESEFFDVQIVPAEWPAAPELLAIDLGFRYQRTYPSPDLPTMRRNANDLRAYLVIRSLELLERIKAAGAAA